MCCSLVAHQDCTPAVLHGTRVSQGCLGRGSVVQSRGSISRGSAVAEDDNFVSYYGVLLPHLITGSAVGIRSALDCGHDDSTEIDGPCCVRNPLGATIPDGLQLTACRLVSRV